MKYCSSLALVVVLVSSSMVSFFGSAARADTPVLYLSGMAQYVSNALCTLDLATGADTYVAPVALSGGAAANVYSGGLAYDPFMNRLYATGYDNLSVSKLYRINPVTGVATEIGPTGSSHWLSYGGLAFDLETRTLYATGDESGAPVQGTYLYTVDTLTGAASPIGWTGAAGTYLYGLGYDPETKNLYANGYRNWDIPHSALFIVSKTTGAATFVGQHGVYYTGRELNYSGLAFDPGTHVLYSQGSVTGSTCGLYTVDKTTGAATLIGSFSTGNNSTDGGLAFIGGYAPTGTETPPPSMRLYQNHPNPFNPETTIRFDLSKSAIVNLSVFDASGRLVRELLKGKMPAGTNEARWDGRDGAGWQVGSGLYIYRLTAGNETISRKMVLLR